MGFWTAFWRSSNPWPSVAGQDWWILTEVNNVFEILAECLLFSAEEQYTNKKKKTPEILGQLVNVVLHCCRRDQVGSSWFFWCLISEKALLTLCSLMLKKSSWPSRWKGLSRDYSSGIKTACLAAGGLWRLEKCLYLFHNEWQGLANTALSSLFVLSCTKPHLPSQDLCSLQSNVLWVLSVVLFICGFGLGCTFLTSTRLSYYCSQFLWSWNPSQTVHLCASVLFVLTHFTLRLCEMIKRRITWSELLLGKLPNQSYCILFHLFLRTWAKWIWLTVYN